MPAIIWVVCKTLTTVWAPTTTKKFSGPYGITKYSSGWRKDVINQCSEFGYWYDPPPPFLPPQPGFFSRWYDRHFGQVLHILRPEIFAPPTLLKHTHTHTHQHLLTDNQPCLEQDKLANDCEKLRPAAQTMQNMMKLSTPCSHLPTFNCFITIKL